MKVIRITPGLGNQMFQYAFLLNYKLKGEKIALDITPCLNSKKHNGYELERIFGIKEHILTPWEKLKINGPYLYIKEREITFLKFFNKIISKIFGEKFIINSSKVTFDKHANLEFNFSDEYLNLKGSKYISGYFNSWKYFETIKDEVKKIFIFPNIEKSDIKNFDILNKIRNTESVSIHVRRGDYIRTNLDVCDISYFEKAFEIIQSKLNNKNLHIFIFSDNIKWCKDNFIFLKGLNASYIDWNKKENSYKDMQLMSECKHNIISNSTFSWWGGFLNKNLNKIVIAPKYWFKEIKTSSTRIFERWYIT